MPPPAVTFTLDLATPKYNQYICDRNYVCDQNWVKFFSLVSEIWFLQDYRDAHIH